MKILIVLYAAIVMIVAAACSPVPQTDFNRSMDSVETYQYNHNEIERGE